jgi:hypothetical protein
MVQQIVYCDGAGAAAVWVNDVSGITGAGGPLENGVSLLVDGPRSPGQGAIATVEELAGTTADDAMCSCRLSFKVWAVGRGGGREKANRAARALAGALADQLKGNPVTVTTKAGERVTILAASDLAGPSLTGDVGGQSQYRVDATLSLQPA